MWACFVGSSSNGLFDPYLSGHMCLIGPISVDRRKEAGNSGSLVFLHSSKGSEEIRIVGVASVGFSGRGRAERGEKMRKLKYHEKKLLKKVNFLEWKREGGHRENDVMRRYHITSRDDYKKYSKLCRMVQKLVNILKQMDPRDPFRIQITDALLEKLYNMGVISSRKSLALCDRLSVSSFCRRRLSTVLVRLKFAEHLKEAVTYIEQGHIRVGPDTVTDDAYLVTRNMEDLITWVDTSKIRRKVLEYNDKLDDYDAMN